MKEQRYELIRQFLSGSFNYEFYTDGIFRARRLINFSNQTKENWKQIKLIIQNRELEPGQALTLVNHGANQVIDENSDQEAYVWLDKMIDNIERTDDQIDEY